jgi:hypothetical protein
MMAIFNALLIMNAKNYSIRQVPALLLIMVVA